MYSHIYIYEFIYMKSELKQVINHYIDLFFKAIFK